MATENRVGVNVATLRPWPALALLPALAWLAINSNGAWAQTVVGSGGTMEVVKPGGISGGMFGTPPNGGKSSGFGGFGGFGGMVTESRFESKVAPNTPLNNLLPPPPSVGRPLPGWLVKDLSQVPEIYFQKPLQMKGRTSKAIENKMVERAGQGADDPAEREALTKELKEANQAETNLRAQIACTLAKINHLNQKDPDHFLTVLMENRGDLAGLPFLKGEACRMSKEVSRRFVQEIFSVPNQVGGQLGGLGGMSVNVFGSPAGKSPLGVFVGGGGFATATQDNVLPKPNPDQPADDVTLARVAAWMQTSPENTAKRAQIVKTLAAIKHPAATSALGKLAVFAPEKSMREEALAVLKDRPVEDYTTALVAGLHYPWPETAQNATEAIVKLQRDELIDELVNFLDEPDPRAPFEQEKNGRKVRLVHEVVRLNHHHNCITCHAPATSDADFNKNGWTMDFVAAHVTVPGQGLAPPSPGLGYSFGGTRFPDLAVRVDVTYLRQDFSLMQKVENGMSGRPEERFDFLVRTRELKDNEVKAYDRWREKQGLKYLSPNHQAALAALRRLTGRDAEPTAAAWREALGEE